MTTMMHTSSSTGLKLAALAFSLALVGCGQRGDLYLPSEASASQRATLGDTLTPRPGPAAPSPTAQP
jgi:predicted small lipoprotein YifL